MSVVLLHGRGGLGDAVYMRPFVREAAIRHLVYVDTSWPEMYADLPARVCERMGGLPLQRWHGDKHPPNTWHRLPAAKPINLRYRWHKLNRRSMLAEMEKLSKIRPAPLRLDLPPLPIAPLSGSFVIIKPPAQRKDYPGPAREPAVEYVHEAVAMLRADDRRIVTLCVWVPGMEEPDGPPIDADIRFENGDVSLMQALALVAAAELVVCGPCWMVPVAMAAGTPCVVIAGGCGGRNNPAAIADSRLGADVRWILPDQYCTCVNRLHDCPKHISDFSEKFAEAAAMVAVVAA